MSDQIILQVAIPTPLRRTFDYLPPLSGTDHPIKPGQRIKIPFGPRTITGIITQLKTSSDISKDKLKHAYQIIDTHPLIPPHIMTLCVWTARYYHHSLGDVFTNALPNKLRQGAAADSIKAWLWQYTEKGQLIDIDSLKRAPKQASLLKLLREHPQGLSAAILKGLNQNLTTLTALRKKGLIEKHPLQRHLFDPAQILNEPELPLNPEQTLALETIKKAPPDSAFLLAGVTGSGKTEVYLQLIAQCLRQGRQALVLVPEIGLTPQTSARLQHRFNVPIVAIHSGLSEGERLHSWVAAQRGEALIIIGTRSAIFTPLPKPGIIIIDEEHDLSYKQQDGLRYCARDLALLRGKKEAIPVLLASATPSLESLHNAQSGRYQLLTLTQRANDAKMPKFNLLDMRQQTLTHGLSEKLIKQIEKHLSQDQQVLVFVNRRGFAPVLLCQQCGWTAKCPQCETHFTLHKSPAHLHCHHCNKTQAIPLRCPPCGNTDLRPVGAGTERLEEGLSELFPNTPLVRIDRDSTQRKHSFKEKLAQINQGLPMLLLGTQMLAKGHHFPDVTLVAIINADSGFLSTDFRGPERIAQLIVQVSGRAGRGGKPGQVALQTHQPDNPLLQRLLSEGYLPFANHLLNERRDAELPPFAHAALFRAEANNASDAEAFLQQAADILQSNESAATTPNEHIEILGPVTAPMEKRAGRYRFQLLLQSNQRKPLHQLLHISMPFIEPLKAGRKVRWSLDIDPAELL
ncbi:MAG: primosomal protein N' [Gammaproteobacteria bacterium]|nr:primosomal protein N' [Gammaproteobacteria bacterium]